MTRVKICGVRTVEDAAQMRFMRRRRGRMLLAQSPRRISVEQAKEIVASLPPFVTPVIVMMPHRRKKR